MDWNTGLPQTVELDGVVLECVALGPPPGDAPTIVLLHEGLGCVAMWRDFPERLQQATGHGVFVYSRQGYGRSSPCPLPRPVDYMEREASEVLPSILDIIGFERGILFGHSDGGTIAGLYLGNRLDHRVRGLILMAPHFFAEADQLEHIRKIRETYRATDLRERLARHHGGNVDCAFYGWADTWLDPRFAAWDVSDAIGYVRVPILFIQGKDDPYGSQAQADVVTAESYAPVDVHMLDDCRHAPQFEQAERTLAIVCDFVERLERIDQTGHSAA
jgi:pimeloyl-ACP methyl ester carboxylesterase